MCCHFVDDLACFFVKCCCGIFLYSSIRHHVINNIKFTKEEEENNVLPYLDTKLIRTNNTIKVNWYQKPTSSGRLINYFSKHPKHIIRNTAYNFIKRVLSISDTIFHDENHKIIRSILIKNSFPHYVINNLLSKFSVSAL